jgi:hypothetical protein
MDNSRQQGKKEDRRGQHPNSRANLEKGPIARWKKGQSGNPDGFSLTGLAKKLLNEVPNVLIDKKPNTKTWRELIVQAWLVGSYQGNATYFKELMERIEGKVAQPVTGKDGEALMPRSLRLFLADGTVIKPPRNGHQEVEVGSDGDGHGQP